MNYISKYIEELLYYNDCVIIPNLGGFISNHKASYINSDHNIFSPPSKELTFNKKLKTNDGLLINFIQTKEELNYIEANEKVTKFVDKIKKQLEQKNSVTINNLGSFQLDENKNIIFNTDLGSNLCIESYGFESFHFPELEKKETVKHIKEKFRDKEAVKQTIKHPITKKIIVGLPLIIILLFLPFKSNIIDNNYEEANFVHSFKTSYGINLDNPNNINNVIEDIANKENALLYIEPVKTDEKIYTKIDTIFIDSIDAIENLNSKETYSNEENAKPIEKPKYNQEKSNDKYFIIAGSFAEESRANKFCEKIQNKGYNTTILDRHKGRLRVSIESFSDKNEAKIALDKYRSQSDLSLWLLSL